MSTEQKDYNLSPKEFAHLVGVSSSTVRRWEEEKVFTSVRTLSGYRKFALSDVPKAKEYKNTVAQIKKQKSQENLINKSVVQGAVSKKQSNIAEMITKHAVFLAVSFIVFIFTASTLIAYPSVKEALKHKLSSNSPEKVSDTSTQTKYPETSDLNVLAAESTRLARSIISNIGWNFRSSVEIEDLQVNGSVVFLTDIDAQGQNLDLASGSITASNILYGIVAGEGIAIAGQTQIPLITNIDPGSAQEIFKNIKVGSNTVTAQSNTDTLTFEQGSGITLSVDGKKITISSSQLGSSKWTVTSDVIYPTDYATADFSLGGTNSTTSPLGFDITQNILYLGDGNSDTNTPTIYFKASDGTNSGTFSYADSDRFIFSGGDVTIDGVIYSGSGVQQLTLANGLLNPSSLPLITSGTTPTTNSVSGLEVVNSQIGLIRGCANGEVLKWNSGTSRWTCSADSSGVSGVIDVQEDGGVPAGSADSQFDTINFVNNFTLVENTSGVVDIDLASNVGIGTGPSGSYALTVNGATNTTTLYLSGTQITANANEINLLSGRSGTLLDTANAATQLSAWDQNASDDVVTGDIGTSVQGFNASTSFLGQTIEGSEITNGTITASDFASTLTFASGVFIDLSSINHGSTAPQGLRLPNATSANLAANNPSSGVGYLAYDTDVNKVKIFNGVGWTDISGASTTLQEAYEAGNAVLMAATDGNIRISNDGLQEVLFLDEATGYVGIGNTSPGYKLDVSGAIRIASGNDLYIGTIGVGSTAGAGLIGVDSTAIVNSSSSILQTVLEDLDSAIGGVGSSSISAVGNITAGDAFTSGTPGSELYFTSSGVLGLGNTGSSAARIEFYNDTTDRIAFLSSYVGIGTTAPVSVLDVQGAIRLGVSGGLTDTLNTISAGTAPSASLYWGSYRICTTGDSCAGGDGGGVASTGEAGYLAKFTDQDNIENSVLFETGGQIGIGKTNPSEVLDIVGDIAVSGTVDGRDISTDGSNLDTLYTTIGLSSLASAEVDQLENIGTNSISSAEWGYLAVMNQSVATTDAVTFTTINTGQGAYELYAMNQGVQTSDTVQFAGLQLGGATPTLSSIVAGTGTDWSGAADTEIVTRLAIKSYVDSQVTGSAQNIWSTINADSGSTSANTTSDALTINGSGSITTAIAGDTLTITGTDNDTTYSAGSGLGLSTTTFNLGGAITQPARLYDLSYEYLYLNNSTGNLGIGTTSTGTYKLNVNGSLNTTNLYLAGSEVTSTAAELNLLDGVNLTLTAAEFNLLDGRSGTLLDTNNAATQLSAWDQDSSNDALVTSLTSGYLPYFDGSNLANTDVFVTGSSIGIGTTSPAYALDVVGDIRIVSGSELYSYGSATLGGRVYTEDNYVTDGQTFTASIDALDQQLQNLSNGEAGMWQDQSGYINPINATSFAITDTGRVGIGTTAPVNPLSVVGNANFTGNVGIGTTEVGTYALNVNGNANVLGFYIGGTQVTSTATELNTLDGVNATLTSAELNYLDNATVTNGGIVFGDGTKFTQDAGNFFWNDSTNRLGIGTTAPSATLDLFGTTAGLQMTYDANNYGKFTIGNDGTLTLAGVSAGGSLTNIARFATTGVDIDVPTSFNATGDVSIANDLQFTNQTASYIKTLGPLTIEAGESYESNNLKLKTYNSGRIILDSSGGVALNQVQNWDLISSSAALTIENDLLSFDTANSRIGIGTTVPLAKLDIRGTGWIRGGTGTSGGVYVNGSGFVGIGTTNPTEVLEILSSYTQAPTITITENLGSSTPYTLTEYSFNNGTNLGRIAGQNVNGVSTFYLYGTAARQIALGSNSSTTPHLLINTSGYVGIGTTNPTSALEVVGDINTSTLYKIGGSAVLSASSSRESVYVGIGAGNTAPSGSTQLTLIGHGAGNSINSTSADQNTFVGSWAGSAVTSGYQNVIIGNDTAGSLTTGSNNFVGGAWAGVGSTASYNVSLGYSAGGSNISGNDNVMLGAYADVTSVGNYSVVVGSNAQTAYSSSIALGYSASPTASNQLLVGGNNTNGFINDAYFGRGVVSATPNDITFNATGGSGTDITGANIILAGGKATGNADGGDILFKTSDIGSSGSTLQTLTEKMRLTHEGYLGIGTTAPGYNLDVNGSGNFTSLYIGGSQLTATATELNILSGATVSTAELNYLDNATVTNGGIVFGDGTKFTQDAGNFFWNDSTNRLGIGTTAPSATLDLFGTTAGLQMTYDANNYGKFTIGNDGTLTLAGVSAGGSLTNIARFATTGVDIDVPTSFNATGDVSIANDLQFTNQTASYIKTLGPLTIEAGELFENNNLTVKTYGTGNVVLDLAGTGNAWLTGTDTSLVFDTRSSSDTDFWMGIIDDAGNDDDDLFAIGDGDVSGTNPFISIKTNGYVGIGTTTPTTKLDLAGTAWLRGGTGDTGLYVNGSGQVGIGKTNPTSSLDISYTNSIDDNFYPALNLAYTDNGAIQTNSVSLAGINVSNNIASSNIATSGGSNAYGINSAIDYSGTVSTAGSSTAMNITGVYGNASFSGTVSSGNNIANVFGIRGNSSGDLGTAGLQTNHYGGSFLASGTAKNNYGIYTSVSGATNNYGLYIASLAEGAGNYSIYSSALAKSYFAGSVGIGTTAPTSNLTVSGDSNITGNLGIGTTDVTTYRLNVAGTGNFTTLAIAGTNITSTATELNYLDGSTVTNGGIVFGDGTKMTQDAGNFFWNDSTNRLGIGTTNPSSSLELFGTTAGLQMTYDANNYGKFTIGNDGTLTLAGVSGGGSLTNIARFSTTGVDIDVPTSFNASGDVSIAYDLYFTNQTASYVKSDGPLSIVSGEAFESNDLTLETYGTGNIILTANSGNLWADGTYVGIGTTNPEGDLQVMNSDVSGARGIISSIYSSANPARGAAFSGRRARGTESSPTTVSTGDAVVSFEGAGYDGTDYIDSADIKYIVDGTVSTGTMPLAIQFRTGSNSATERMRISSSGDVGIGTTAPARALHVQITSDAPPVRFQDSNGYCEINPTTTTWTCTSDASLKHDVNTLSSISNLQKLNQLRPVSFQWNTQQDDTKRYGLIAQEVEQIFPEFVQTDEKGLKSVSYGSFTPILISAMQEQQLSIIGQENTLTKLSEELALVVNQDTGVVMGSILDTITQETEEIVERTLAIEGEVEALAAKDTEIESRLNTVEDRLDALEHASASAGLDILNERVGFLEQLFTGIQASGSADLSTYLADLIDGQVLGLQTEEATLSALTVSGDANINNLGVTGEISSGILTINGFDDSLATPSATISTLGGSLELQHLGLGEIEFMAGKSKIDTDGNFIILEGDLVVESGVIKGNDQFRGINLPAEVGLFYLDVEFNTEKETEEYAVNVTPNWLTNIAVINKRTDGFRIQFSTPAPIGGTVDWLIIE